MYYPDLATECQVHSGPNVRAIGWLSREHPFPTGDVAAEWLSLLRQHIASAARPLLMMGFHPCDLCPPPEVGRPFFGGAENVWIPTPERLYVAPELIEHYIEAHRYLPPQEFVEAVQRCPLQGSAEFESLLDRFPNELVLSRV